MPTQQPAPCPCSCSLACHTEQVASASASVSSRCLWLLLLLLRQRLSILKACAFDIKCNIVTHTHIHTHELIKLLQDAATALAALCKAGGSLLPAPATRREHTRTRPCSKADPKYSYVYVAYATHDLRDEGCCSCGKNISSYFVGNAERSLLQCTLHFAFHFAIFNWHTWHGRLPACHAPLQRQSKPENFYDSTGSSSSRSNSSSSSNIGNGNAAVTGNCSSRGRQQHLWLRCGITRVTPSCQCCI